MAFASQVILTGLLMGGLYALIALGLSLIFGVQGVINFAHGEFLMLAMYCGFFLWKFLGLDPLLALPAALAAFYLFGVLFQRVFIEPLTRVKAPHSAQLMVTYGVSMALQGLAMLLWSPDHRSVTTPYQGVSWQLGEVVFSFPRTMAFLTCMVVGGAVLWIYHRTDLGRSIRASASNPWAAELTGVDTRKVVRQSFGLGAAVVAAAAVVMLPFYNVWPTVGQSFLMISFIAVVMGGLGNIVGTLLAGLILGVFEAVTVAWISSELSTLMLLLLFLGVLYLRPQGIFGRRARV